MEIFLLFCRSLLLNFLFLAWQSAFVQISQLRQLNRRHGTKGPTANNSSLLKMAATQVSTRKRSAKKYATFCVPHPPVVPSCEKSMRRFLFPSADYIKMHFAPKTASCHVIFFSLCQFQFNVRRQQTGKGSGLQSLTKQRFSTRRKLQIYNGNAPPLPNPPHAQSRHGCVHNFYARSKSGQTRGISAPQLPLSATPKLQRRKIAMHWGLAAQWERGRGRRRRGGTDDRTSCKSLKASVWTCVFCILQARHGLPHSAKCSSNQRCSNCAARPPCTAERLLPSARIAPRFVATFYAFFQRLRRRLLFQVQDKCDSIKPCHAPNTAKHAAVPRNLPLPFKPPSFSFSHRREAKNCQA